ncbi:MAG: penicillin-binding protein activator [Alphaproteobacteria bacterium]|nr:penicillin-binding protein activator [Alphaproteobacteria bacterium]
MKKFLALVLFIAACADKSAQRPRPITPRASGHVRVHEEQRRAYFEGATAGISRIDSLELGAPPPRFEEAQIGRQIIPSESSEARTGRRRIAVLLPKNNPVAEDLKRAAQLALFNLRNDSVELVFFDTDSTRSSGRDAAREAVAGGADVIVGPLFGDAVEGAAGAASNIPVISFTTNRDAVGKNAFSIGLMLEDQTAKIARFAAGADAGRLLILTPDSTSGRAVRRAFRDSAAGIEIAGDAVYDKRNLQSVIRKLTNYDERSREHSEYSKSVEERLAYLIELREKFPEDYEAVFDHTRFANSDAEVAFLEALRADLRRRPTLTPAPFDSVFIFGDDVNDLVMIGSTLSYFDVRPDSIKIFGLSQMNNDAVLREISLRGAFFPMANSALNAKFEAAFERYFRAKPNRLAAQAYDAVALAAALPRIDVAALRDQEGFAGLLGAFRFKPDGTAERAMDIMQIISNGRARVVKPAEGF